MYKMQLIQRVDPTTLQQQEEQLQLFAQITKYTHLQDQELLKLQEVKVRYL